jgi:hypothetical protein
MVNESSQADAEKQKAVKDAHAAIEKLKQMNANEEASRVAK